VLSTDAQPVSMAWFEIALVIFFVVFLAIVIWVIFARRGRFRDAARIPLEEDRVVTSRHERDGDRASEQEQAVRTNGDTHGER